MKKTQLSKYEKDLEKNLEKNPKSKNQKKLQKSLIIAAKAHLGNKKPITIRVAENDIEAIKIKAGKMGIPYQTYINILIHRDAILA